MIAVEGLTKRYGRRTAVDAVSFRCRPGTVTGLLGPEGAGKTTTLRMITGLTSPTRGTATLGGHRYVDLPNPGRHVGVLLDASAQHPGRTGREALTLAALTLGVDVSRVEQVLEAVGLGRAEARHRVGSFSPGTTQRLGVAQALLGDPRILVLDEPTTDLEPSEVPWLRGLLREYVDRGGTVLLSAHLLRDVQILADEVVLLDRGRLVGSGSTADLVHGHGAFAHRADVAALLESLVDAAHEGALT